MTLRCRNRRGGFTLVELMVGLAVGLFVSVIAISLFVSTRKLQSVNSSSNRMSENARLAFDLLHKDLRLVGFRGCTDLWAKAPVSVLNTVNDDFLVDASGVRGHRGTGSALTPTPTGALAGIGALPNSDVISVRVPADTLSLGLVATMATNVDSPNVGTATNGSNLFAAGDVAMMSNCKNAVLFQVSAGGGTPAATGLLAHDVGGGLSPGNLTANLGARYNRADTAIYRMQTRHYYVAPSAVRTGTNSLWRLTVPAPAGEAAAQEVVPGIDRLNIRYGLEVDATADRSVDRYVTADNVGTGNWGNVLTARIEMLSSTTDNGTAQAPTTVQFAGNAVVGTDRRLREVFTEVVSFRNLMP